MSQLLSGPGGSQRDYQEEIEDQAFDIYGMYFCGTCKNIMAPVWEMQEKLNLDVDFVVKKLLTLLMLLSNNALCIIYNKQLKPGSKASKADKQFVKDPALPKVYIQCPECEHDQAFYIVTPDQGETSIEVQLICGNTLVGRCQKIWTLPPNYLLQGFEIKET